MIHFKITNTPDKSQQSVYQHEGDQLILGKEEGDMIIDDPSIAPKQLRIYSENGAYFLENLDPSVEIKISGKPVDGILPLNGKEIVNFGKTTLALTGLNSQTPSNPEVFYYNRSERFASGRAEKVILDALEFLASSLNHDLLHLSPIPPSSESPAPPSAPSNPGNSMPPMPPPKPGMPKPPPPKIN